jgi:hypothetical protein
VKRTLLGIATIVGVPILVGSAMGIGAFLIFRGEEGNGDAKHTVPEARREVSYRQLLFDDTATLSEKTGQHWKVRRTFRPAGTPESSIGRLWLNENSVNLEEQVYKFANPGNAGVYFNGHLPSESADRDDLPDTTHVLNPNGATGTADEAQLVCVTNAPTHETPSRCFRWILLRKYGQYVVRISMTMPSGGPELSRDSFSICISVFDGLITQQIS